MGSAYGYACYELVSEAQSAFCAGSYPRSRVDDTGNHISEACTVGVAGVSLVSTVAETGIASTVAFPMTFADCDPSLEIDLLAALFVSGVAGLVGIMLVRMTFWPLTQNQ